MINYPIDKLRLLTLNVGLANHCGDWNWKNCMSKDHYIRVFKQETGETPNVFADKPALKADGQDLVYITIEVVDAQGRVCPDAAIPCEATVQGQGRLIAFATANLQDREPKTSARVTTWKGRALLVVRSTNKKGKAKVTIKSNLPSATLSI